jgi:hypothetical protein
VVGVAMHFGVSMRYTHSTLAISRLELFLKGMLRPAAMAIPSILLCLWWLAATSPLKVVIACAWVVSTLLMAWFISLTRVDRDLVVRVASGKMNLS